MKLINREGQRFGRLLVVTFVEQDKNRHAKWYCRCDCGGTKVVRANCLVSGNTRSCGCLAKEQWMKRFFRHGHTMGFNRPTFSTWKSMMNRCNDPKAPSFSNYGGRGIKVCERWSDGRFGFLNFLNDMGLRPQDTSLDRIDVNGNYELGNCRWATKKEQSNNRRNKRIEQFSDEVLVNELRRRRLVEGQRTMNTVRTAA
jgi:hypothetical protein